jgi:hypothetical protein
MSLFLNASIINDAVKRLVDSRAQRGFTDFIILKRALKRTGKDIVQFSMKDQDFTDAIRDVAGIQSKKASVGSQSNDYQPFFKVFGIAQGVSMKMLTNGPADTLSGANWHNIVKVEGQRPRCGKLMPGYENYLEPLLLKREGSKPTLADAAIWYYRSTDLSSMNGGSNQAMQNLLPMLTSEFIKDIGLTKDEILHLFESQNYTISTLSVADCVSSPVSPVTYLPNCAQQTNDNPRSIAQIAKVFRSAATDNAVGLQLPHGVPSRFIAALLSKRFVILTGLSGSGKTKLAQAFAQWITPNLMISSPFVPGARIKGAQNSYTVVKVNAGVIELAEDNGKLVALPMSIVEEWADYIQENNISENISARELRDRIEAKSKYISYLHRLESHYKPLAFALLENRKSRAAADCYAVIPVGADWTNSEHILGYPDALRSPVGNQPGVYVTKKALQLIRRAANPASASIPHFLILDEMNLSHVERYFADVLSAIESCEPIPLHDGGLRIDENGDAITSTITLPDNLFIIGTVNVDETTYMFSPKVLDRANVIEFAIDEKEIVDFLNQPKSIDLSQIAGKGAVYGEDFVKQSSRRDITLDDLGSEIKCQVKELLSKLFASLALVGAEFGYRAVYEITRFVVFHEAVSDLPWSLDTALDAAIMQKLLPKLNGSKTKLGPILAQLKNAVTKEQYPISFAKIERMELRLKQNGFTSYTEA